ncbi:DUF4190 domain-containing protein [Haloactinomyces albus]|uniref:PAB1-binding protein PBP1 n=1 Tax=Haloactinomyces albus TaxID=1352928 RepID=A0AAE3ZBQ0_9ACTN|nr:DUF4190 domain-containing protein [Haloactinomyces albus]MDR7300905.1 PAB1-binding protein PBP1 [Haloactinomyces albus]
MTNPYGQGYYGSQGPHQYDPYGSGSPLGFPHNMPPASEAAHPQASYPQAGVPVYGYLAPYRPTHSLATASLILSLAGLVCGLPAIGGVITGHMARKRIREEPYYDGAGMALAGVIIGWIITGFILAYLTFVILMMVVATTSTLG